MTTPENHEATQTASNPEASRTVVSAKNRHTAARINQAGILTEKTIIARANHLALKNSQTKHPLEGIIALSVQKTIRIGRSTKEDVHLIKMMLLDHMTKETISDVQTKMIPDHLIKKKVVLKREIPTNVMKKLTGRQMDGVRALISPLNLHTANMMMKGGETLMTTKVSMIKNI